MNFNKIWKAGSIWLIAVAFLTSCTKDQTSPVSCPPCPSNISFKAAIIPIFQANCAIAGCHNATTDAFSLNLDSVHAYANATEPGTGNVTPYSAGNSLLYTIVASGGMPLDYPRLPACEVEEIACWINQGAQNN